MLAPGQPPEPLSRSHSSGRALLGSHIFQPRHPIQASDLLAPLLSSPSTLPVSVSALIPLLPSPSNTRPLFPQLRQLWRSTGPGKTRNSGERDSATFMTSTRRSAGAGEVWGVVSGGAKKGWVCDREVWRVRVAAMPESHPLRLPSPRGAFSYLRRVVERSSGLEFAAKFIPSQAKPKASAWREARLLARLQHDCVLYFHEAFERRRGLVIVTELYPGTGWGSRGDLVLVTTNQ